MVFVVGARTRDKITFREKRRLFSQRNGGDKKKAKTVRETRPRRITKKILFYGAPTERARSRWYIYNKRFIVVVRFVGFQRNHNNIHVTDEIFIIINPIGEKYFLIFVHLALTLLRTFVIIINTHTHRRTALVDYSHIIQLPVIKILIIRFFRPCVFRTVFGKSIICVRTHENVLLWPYNAYFFYSYIKYIIIIIKRMFYNDTYNRLTRDV